MLWAGPSLLGSQSLGRFLKSSGCWPWRAASVMMQYSHSHAPSLTSDPRERTYTERVRMTTGCLEAEELRAQDADSWGMVFLVLQS